MMGQLRRSLEEMSQETDSLRQTMLNCHACGEHDMNVLVDIIILIVMTDAF